MTIPTLFRRTSLTLAALGSALVLACGTEGGMSGSPPPVPQDGGTGVQVDGGPDTPDAGPADAGAQVPDGGFSLHGLLPADGGGTILWPDHSITRPTGRVQIVEIGDSITQGGGPGNMGEVSYRYPLWRKLVLAGANFDMVGSMRAGFENDPPWPDVNGVPFDRDHEWHWGWQLNGIRDELAGWLQGYTPDIALVMLGTNDPGGEPDPEHPERGMAVEAGEIFDLLRADNPRRTRAPRSLQVVHGGALHGEPVRDEPPVTALRQRLGAHEGGAPAPRGREPRTRRPEELRGIQVVRIAREARLPPRRVRRARHARAPPTQGLRPLVCHPGRLERLRAGWFRSREEQAGPTSASST